MQNHPRLASYDERVSIKNLLLTVTMVTTVTGGVNEKLRAPTVQRQHVKGAYAVIVSTQHKARTTVRSIVQLFTCLIVQLSNVLSFVSSVVTTLTNVLTNVLSLSSGRSSTTHRQSINFRQSQRATNYRVATQNQVGVKQ